MTEYKIGDNVVFTTNQGQSSGKITNVENDYFDGVRVGIKYTIHDAAANNTYFTGVTNRGINTNNVEIKHKLGGGRRRMKSKRKIMRKKSTRRRK